MRLADTSLFSINKEHLSDNKTFLGLCWFLEALRLIDVWYNGSCWCIGLYKNSDLKTKDVSFNFTKLSETLLEPWPLTYNEQFNKGVNYLLEGNVTFNENNIIINDKPIFRVPEHERGTCRNNVYPLCLNGNQEGLDYSEVRRLFKYLKITNLLGGVKPESLFTKTDSGHPTTVLLDDYHRYLIDRNDSVAKREFGVYDPMYSTFPPYVHDELNQWVLSEIGYLRQYNDLYGLGLDGFTYPPYTIKLRKWLILPHSPREYNLTDFGDLAGVILRLGD